MNIIHAQEPGGYTGKDSYYKGESVEVYISTQVSNFDLSIFRIEETNRLIATFPNIEGGLQVTRDSSFHYGAGWNVTYSFIIPDDWEPGYYRGEFPIEEGRRGFTFIVKNPLHGTWSNILLVASTNTFQAYNEWGGKSLYNYNSSDSMRAFKVSFRRPFPSAWGSYDFYNYEYKFIRWSENNNIKMEIVSNYDVHANPSLVHNYDVVLIVGHNEYWSLSEREAYESFYGEGGNIIILSGNTSWWQVRFEDDGNTLVCYKSVEDDPMTNIDNRLVTTNWFREPVNNPENKITGLSFLYGGFVNIRGYYPANLGYGDYNAVRTHHWIYDGTSLIDGDEFGYDDSIVGIEVDGAHFEWIEGLPIVTSIDQTPPTFTILALSPAFTMNLSENLGFGTMGYFYNDSGGMVFNAATTGWVDGLGNDPVVDRITHNVLNKFLAGKFPPEIISWQPYEVRPAVFNNQSSFINKRNIFIEEGHSMEFSVTAEDIHGENVNYFWMKDDEIISTSGTLRYVNDEVKKNVITAYAFNNYDTASIYWNVFSTDFAFASEPETNLEINRKYYYRMDVFNRDEDQVFFELLHAPDWIKLDSNVISGISPEDGNFYFSVKAYTSTKEDIQSFNLYVSGISSDDKMPQEFHISNNYPNPFNPVTTISMEIPFTSEVSVRIYDIMGREVRNLQNEVLPAGYHTLTWDSITNDGISAGSGIYFCVVKAGSFSRTIKMVLMK
jgi:hypothetical protein